MEDELIFDNKELSFKDVLNYFTILLLNSLYRERERVWNYSQDYFCVYFEFLSILYNFHSYLHLFFKENLQLKFLILVGLTRTS